MFSFSLTGVGAMSLQEIAPASMRGQAAALFAGVLNIIGAGLGPVAVGVLTDYVLRDPSAIGTAIVATCVTASVVGLALFRSGFATYSATCADAAAWRGYAGAGNPDCQGRHTFTEAGSLNRRELPT
jgi:MFS family permease